MNLNITLIIYINRLAFYYCLTLFLKVYYFEGELVIWDEDLF